MRRSAQALREWFRCEEKPLPMGGIWWSCFVLIHRLMTHTHRSARTSMAAAQGLGGRPSPVRDVAHARDGGVREVALAVVDLPDSHSVAALSTPPGCWGGSVRFVSPPASCHVQLHAPAELRSHSGCRLDRIGVGGSNGLIRRW